MSKNKVEVVIGGSIYSLQGEESDEHIQRVAQLINTKIKDITQSDKGKRLSLSQVHMLAAMNIANEYLKTKDELDVYINELEKCNSENMALLERIDEMGLELNKLKSELHNK